MLVTIGIPTFNRADTYLEHALKSAMLQTYSPLEIIVADNCSTDKTEEFVNSCKDSRVRYVKHQNPLKPWENFNFCLQEAQGTYFLLLHDDDLIDPDFIAICMNALKTHKDAGLIRTGMRRIDTNGELFDEQANYAQGLSTKDFFKAWFDGGKTTMHLCCTLFNTKHLREVGAFQSPKKLFLDVVPEVKLAAKFGRIDIKEIKASFRKHSFNLAKTGRIQEWCEDSQYLYSIMEDLVGNHDQSFKKAGMNFFIKHCFRYARTIQSTKNRFVAYFIIYSAFQYSGRFFIKRIFLKPAVNWLKQFKNKPTN